MGQIVEQRHGDDIAAEANCLSSNIHREVARQGVPSGKRRAHTAFMEAIHTDKPWKGHFVRAWRKAKGLTLQQVADRLAEEGDDTSPGSLSKLERGETNLTERKIYLLSHALGIEPGALFVRPDIYYRQARRLQSIDSLTDDQIEQLAALAKTFKQG